MIPTSRGARLGKRRGRAGVAAALVCTALATLGCHPERGTREPFRDVTAEVGVRFEHASGKSGQFYFCEIVGPGVGLFDVDSDGDLDLYLVQGGPLGDPAAPAPSNRPSGDRLLRNLVAETGRLRFEDITTQARIEATGYGMGVAVGDYDNDGHADLYVTCFGPNQMLRNQGDGTFQEVTDLTGTGDDRWSTSAAFLDYDRDGWLDLFVCNYVDFTLATHKECYSGSSARDYCGPLSYEPLPNRLFRNLGDGRFEDVTAPAGVALRAGGALGVVAADMNGDGWLDLYVANDGRANQFWVNQGDGTFRDDALLSGCAYNEHGKAEASMGIDAGDFDNDGDEDLFLSHLTDETNTLYLNDGRGRFVDATGSSGLGLPSRPYTGFGTAWLDFDNDGWLDLFIANGAVKTIEAQARAGDPHPLGQRNQLFRNQHGRFVDLTEAAGAPFRLAEVSRGAAFGDLDNDGDPDIVVSNNHGPTRILLNSIGAERSWIGLRLLLAGGRDAYGALASVTLADGTTRVRRCRADASYCSANDPRILVGLGTFSGAVAVRVRWPDGQEESWAALESGRYHVLRAGTSRTP